MQSDRHPCFKETHRYRSVYVSLATAHFLAAKNARLVKKSDSHACDFGMVFVPMFPRSRITWPSRSLHCAPLRHRSNRFPRRCCPGRTAPPNRWHHCSSRPCWACRPITTPPTLLCGAGCLTPPLQRRPRRYRQMVVALSFSFNEETGGGGWLPETPAAGERRTSEPERTCRPSFTSRRILLAVLSARPGLNAGRTGRSLPARYVAPCCA